MAHEFTLQFPSANYDLGGTRHRPPDVFTTPDSTVIHFDAPEGFLHLSISRSPLSETKYLLGLGNPDQQTHTIARFNQEGTLTSISLSLLGTLISELASRPELDPSRGDTVPQEIVVMQSLVSGLTNLRADVTALLDIESWEFAVDCPFYDEPVTGIITVPTFFGCLAIGGPPIGFLFSIRSDHASISIESSDAVYAATTISRRPPFHLISKPAVHPARFNEFLSATFIE